jgi:hypothetical protein
MNYFKKTFLLSSLASTLAVSQTKISNTIYLTDW